MSNRTANTQAQSALRTSESKINAFNLLRAVVIGAMLAGTMTACSSGDGGNNGGAGSPSDGPGVGVTDPSQAGGLIFSYPVNGQTNVYPGSQIAFAFNGDAKGNVALRDGNGNTLSTQLIAQDNGIFNLRVTDSDAQLAPNTQYAVVADGTIGQGNTRFNNNDTLFAFTTAPAAGAASADGFSIVSHRGDRNDAYPFTQFNPVRATFSQPVAEGSVELCTGSEALGDNNCTVAVTGPSGNVPGRLTVLGRNLVFDPGTGYVPITSNDAGDYADQDLAADTQYTVAFGSGFTAASGDSLSGGGFSVTPVSIGRDVIQNLVIAPLDDNGSPLNGRTRNNIELASQLIGSYELAATPIPSRGEGLKVRLAAPSNKASFKGTFPTVLPRGQAFQLGAFNLKLGSQLNSDGSFSEGQVDTPINLDNLTAQFANDVDAFITANDLRNIEQPTRVQLRLDLNVTGTVPQGSPIAALSNGVINQTVLDVVASGIAVPQENGDVALITLGSFPIKVNRDTQAAVNFELELTLPASADDQPTILADQIAPFITAQYPSACLYTFNTLGSTGQNDDMSTDEDESVRMLFQSGDVVGSVSGTTTLSDIEANCINVLGQRAIIATNETSEIDGDTDAATAPTYNFPNAWANSFPLGSDPSILFSEAVDPGSLAGNVSLIDGSGNLVANTVRTEGSSVVIHPLNRLEADTQYTVMVDSGVTDLSGNGVNSNFPGSSLVSTITFTTEPMVVPTSDDGTPTIIDRSEREAVRQTAPFLTVLTPGLPCALMTSDEEPKSDFRSGGNTAGRCVGDDPDIGDQYLAPNDPDVIASGAVPPSLQVPGPTSVNVVYPVFSQPANGGVDGYFSKPVEADTVRLANGCLVGGSGNTNDEATIAVQTMDGNGNCTGVVPGRLATLTPGSSLTRGFSFRPEAGFVSAQRYWIVVCGSKNTLDAQRNPELDQSNNPVSQCSTGKTIIGQNGLALNTNPLDSSGSAVSANANSATQGSGSTGFEDCQGRQPNSSAACYDDYRGEGGPDILMPFTGAPATANYVTTTLALPEADTNGNGYFDNTQSGDFFSSYASNNGQGNRSGYRIQGANTGEDRDLTSTDFNDSLGRERAQFANVVLTQPVAAISAQFGLPFAGTQGFLGGGRTVDIGAAATGAACGAVSQVKFDNGESVVGGSPASCLPVALPPSAMNTISSVVVSGRINTGRLFLRFPYAADAQDQSTGEPQEGYIVPKCEGSTPQGQSYDYQPCFVANLRLTVSGPDGAVFGGGTPTTGTTDSVRVPQQDLSVQVFGPVAFEQNGQLIISTKNANRFVLIAYIGSSSGSYTPQPVPTDPGQQALQLVGAPLHGGRAFPTR